MKLTILFFQCGNSSSSIPSWRLCIPADSHAPEGVETMSELRTLGGHWGKCIIFIFNTIAFSTPHPYARSYFITCFKAGLMYTTNMKPRTLHAKVSVRGRHLFLSWVMVSCVYTRSNLPFAGVMFRRPFVASDVEELDPYDRHHLSHTITFHGM